MGKASVLRDYLRSFEVEAEPEPELDPEEIPIRTLEDLTPSQRSVQEFLTSLDEEVARDFILFGQPDVTIVVVDATRLERNLNLVLQVLEITDRVVVCLNLMDEAKRKDHARLHSGGHLLDLCMERLGYANEPLKGHVLPPSPF